jgi:hypothetical protein
MSSFAVLARRSSRRIQIHWGPSRGFSDETLEELFENPFEQLTAAEFERARESSLRLEEQVKITGIGGRNELWNYADGPGLGAAFDARSYPVISYSGGRRAQDLVAPERRGKLLPGFEAEFEQELRGWLPIAEIREQVDALASAFDDQTVGVHVRRGDTVAHPKLGHEYGRSTDEAFFAVMDRMLKRQPATVFFLATDSADTEQRFRARYGRHALVNERKRFVPSRYHQPKDNQRDAVIDLFTLARTRRILGSHYSTFSSTAAILGEIPLRFVVADPWWSRAARKAAYVRHELARRVAFRLGRASGR